MAASAGSSTIRSPQEVWPCESQVSRWSYVVIPAEMVHQFTCAAGADCLLLTRRSEPTDYNFVK